MPKEVNLAWTQGLVREKFSLV